MTTIAQSAQPRSVSRRAGAPGEVDRFTLDKLNPREVVDMNHYLQRQASRNRDTGRFTRDLVQLPEGKPVPWRTTFSVRRHGALYTVSIPRPGSRPSEVVGIAGTVDAARFIARCHMAHRAPKPARCLWLHPGDDEGPGVCPVVFDTPDARARFIARTSTPEAL